MGPSGHMAKHFVKLATLGHYNEFLKSKSAQNRHFLGKKRLKIFKGYFSHFTSAYFSLQVPDAQKNHETHSLRSKLTPKKFFKLRNKNP